MEKIPPQWHGNGRKHEMKDASMEQMGSSKIAFMGLGERRSVVLEKE